MILLARRYATALHLSASGRGAEDEVLEDLAALHETLANGSISRLLSSPDVESGRRRAVVERLGAGRHELVSNLLKVLLRRRRLAVLPAIYPAYRALVMERRGEADGVAESARPLDAGQTADLAALASRLSNKKVFLTVEQKPDLIGGVRLRVGNVLYDGSVKSALDQLEQRLLQARV